MSLLQDFIFSIVWTLMWFIASAAWADRLSAMGTYLDPQTMIDDDLNTASYCFANPLVNKCIAGESGSHATLVVSVVSSLL